MYAANNNVARNREAPGSHLTLLLTTSAIGDILPTLYLYPGASSDIAKIPTEAFSADDNNYHKVTPSAKMDEDTFQQWIALFVSKWLPNYRSDPDEYALLLVDGHASRLNVSTLLTAARNKVIVLCFPSHLTHILQPNNDAFNKRFKETLSPFFTDLAEISESFSTADIASICVKALKKDHSEYVKKSWKNTGIYPISYEKMEKKMEQYNARILTTLQSICCLSLSKELTRVNSLLDVPLRDFMQKTLRFSEEELRQGSGERFKTVDELKEMVYENLKSNWEEKISKMDAIIKGP